MQKSLRSQFTLLKKNKKSAIFHEKSVKIYVCCNKIAKSHAFNEKIYGRPFLSSYRIKKYVLHYFVFFFSFEVSIYFNVKKKKE